jgi:hypothetical protein
VVLFGLSGLSFQLSALILRMEADSAVGESRVKVGYEMIVRQRRVILCKSSAEKFANLMVGWEERPGEWDFAKTRGSGLIRCWSGF